MKSLVIALVFFAGGFTVGVYSLPLIQQQKLERPQISGLDMTGSRTGQFSSELAGSDWLHWGEGEVLLSDKHISLKQVSLAPGPDYRLYLLSRFAEDEAGFLAQKGTALEVGMIQHFSGDMQFALPSGTDIDQYQAVLVWCESFGQFITAAQLN